MGDALNTYVLMTGISRLAHTQTPVQARLVCETTIEVIATNLIWPASVIPNDCKQFQGLCTVHTPSIVHTLYTAHANCLRSVAV